MPRRIAPLLAGLALAGGAPAWLAAQTTRDAPPVVETPSLVRLPGARGPVRAGLGVAGVAMATPTTALAALGRDSVPTPRAAGPSRRRAVAWGAAAGAVAGTLSGLAVIAACDGYCAGVRRTGMAWHVGVGTVAGGAIGALVRHVRH